jgi:hypothetical protein
VLGSVDPAAETEQRFDIEFVYAGVDTFAFTFG